MGIYWRDVYLIIYRGLPWVFSMRLFVGFNWVDTSFVCLLYQLEVFISAILDILQFFINFLRIIHSLLIMAIIILSNYTRIVYYLDFYGISAIDILIIFWNCNYSIGQIIWISSAIMAFSLSSLLFFSFTKRFTILIGQMYIYSRSYLYRHGIPYIMPFLLFVTCGFLLTFSLLLATCWFSLTFSAFISRGLDLLEHHIRASIPIVHFSPKDYLKKCIPHTNYHTWTSFSNKTNRFSSFYDFKPSIQTNIQVFYLEDVQNLPKTTLKL